MIWQHTNYNDNDKMIVKLKYYENVCKHQIACLNIYIYSIFTKNRYSDNTFAFSRFRTAHPVLHIRKSQFE